MSPVVPPFFPAPRGGKLAKHRTSRTAVEQLLTERGDLDGATAITADMARSAADLVDASRKAQDPALWMRASARLDQLVAKLVAKGGGDRLVESGGTDPAAGLEGIVGSPASMGDTEEP